jgi:hypothetical protein
MTKSITITYDESDESLLIAFLKRLKIRIDKTLDADKDDESEGVPLRVAQDIIIGLQQIEQFERGEITLPTWEDMMHELRANEKEAIPA